MAQLGWALLFLLGSCSSVEEGLPRPRAGSLPWGNLPWAPPLPGAEVAESLQGSPPSVRDVLHSGPPTSIHQGSSGFTKVTGRSRLQMIERKGILTGQKGKGQTRTGKRAFRSFRCWARVTFWVFSRWAKVAKAEGEQRRKVSNDPRCHYRKKSKYGKEENKGTGTIACNSTEGV